MNIKVIIDSLDHEGRGIAHLIGKVIRYLKMAEERVTPICPYYNICGGCSLSHLNYHNQLKYKQEKLSNILNKYAKLNPEINVIESDLEYNYRNKIELKIKDYKWGYYEETSNSFIEIKKCLLAKDSINDVISLTNLFKIKSGNIIIRSNYNDELIIKIETKEKYKIDFNTLKTKVKLLGIIVNNKLIYGENEFIEMIDKFLFKVNINSFFQINLNVLTKIKDLLEKEKYHNVVDLYCGVGTLGMFLNKDKLFGIEIVPEAVINANLNAKINQQSNNYYLLGDSSNISKISDKIDMIITDPPRSGLSKETIKYILDNEVKNLIYMSCNPLTLARDLNLLKEKYEIKNCYLFDMFPQ